MSRRDLFVKGTVGLAVAALAASPTPRKRMPRRAPRSWRRLQGEGTVRQSPLRVATLTLRCQVLTASGPYLPGREYLCLGSRPNVSDCGSWDGQSWEGCDGPEQQQHGCSRRLVE